MKVALGVKTHSGWAAVIVLGLTEDGFQLIDRERIELVDESWAKQPYHAAETLEPETARTLVARGIKSAHDVATRQLKALVERETERGNVVSGCAVLTSSPMPNWTVDEILAVHFRMHKAEGVLFSNAMLQAAKDCKLRPLGVAEKTLASDAPVRLGFNSKSLEKILSLMGKASGPPWTKDQKHATVAAMIALKRK